MQHGQDFEVIGVWDVVACCIRCYANTDLLAK